MGHGSHSFTVVNMLSFDRPSHDLPLWRLIHKIKLVCHHIGYICHIQQLGYLRYLFDEFI